MDLRPGCQWQHQSLEPSTTHFIVWMKSLYQVLYGLWIPLWECTLVNRSVKWYNTWSNFEHVMTTNNSLWDNCWQHCKKKRVDHVFIRTNSHTAVCWQCFYNLFFLLPLFRFLQLVLLEIKTSSYYNGQKIYFIFIYLNVSNWNEVSIQ